MQRRGWKQAAQHPEKPRVWNNAQQGAYIKIRVGLSIVVFHTIRSHQLVPP